MAQSAAMKRLRKEYASLSRDDGAPAGALVVKPLETNLLHAHFLLCGHVFYDTPYEGGVYHGVLKFPTLYPMKPPSILFYTPSGRFQLNTKISFSMSDFHPELWNPMWNIRTIITGLVSFMNSEELTTGGLSTSNDERVKLAKQSLQYCLENDAIANELFGTELQALLEERQGLDGSVWPLPRPANKAVETNTLAAVTREETNKDATRTSATREKRRNMNRATTTTATTKNQHPVKETNDDDNEEGPTSRQEPANESNKKKNATANKNRKRRDREKRKKTVQRFLAALREQVPRFVQTVETALLIKSIRTHNLQVDHVRWGMESRDEYSQLVHALSSSADDWELLLTEADERNGGCPAATFLLLDGGGIAIGDHDRRVAVVEIAAPEGRKSGLEHVGFVLREDEQGCAEQGCAANNNSPRNDETRQQSVLLLQLFMDQHPGVDWETDRLSKDCNFPNVSTDLQIDDEFGTICAATFHLVPLAQAIEYEKTKRQQQQE